METESKQATQFSDYPVNLFEESHDHANQWDVSALWPDAQAPAREQEYLVSTDRE